MDMEKLTILKEQIHLSNPIEEVIGERVQLDRHNKALCPFHSEETPSLSVNVNKQYFYCFGCGVGGNVFNFVMLDQKVSFWEAAKYLAQRKGITFPTAQIDFEAEEQRQGVYSLLTETSRQYHRRLPTDVLNYLKSRGIEGETIKRYGIGFCDGNTQFTVDQDKLLKAGLIFENSSREYFEGFITFPHWHHGRVVYISGRGWPDKKHRKLEKDKVPLVHLYNEEAVREKEVILCEGEIDTLTLVQNGFNACGVLGTGSFKEEWVERFKHCQTVYLSLDGDEAGTKANLKIAELLGSKARIVSLPDGQDVNDFFKEKTKEDS